MALIDSEGFGFSTNPSDYPTYNLFIGGQPNGINTGAGGPFGDNYAYIGTYNGGRNTILRRPLGASYPTVFFGIRLNLAPNGTATAILFFDASNAVNVSISTSGGSGVISAYRGNPPMDGGGTLLGSSNPNACPATGFFYMEVGLVIGGGTTGSVVVRVNGGVALNLTGVNTAAVGGSPGTSSWGVEQGSDFSGSLMKFAHIYVCDNSGPAPANTFLGDVRVQTVVPTSNDVVQFAPTGLASNYLNAAKIPPVPASDYNSDSTLGDQDTFNIGAPAASATTIFGVNVRSLLAKSDAGNRQGATVIKSSGTVVAGTLVGLSTSPLLVRQIVPTDPATGVAWTNAGVAAAKIGYKVA